jgi:hypothetical protein
MILIRSLLLTASFMMSGILYSQSTVSFTLPVVTLMDIEPAGNITLNFIAPTEAGNALTNPTPDTSKWINYTSAITSGGLTRRITAAVNSNYPLIGQYQITGSTSLRSRRRYTGNSLRTGYSYH